MQMEKKQIVKEDGRSLIYYHFPASADVAQTAAFTGIQDAQAKQENTNLIEFSARNTDIDLTRGEETRLV